MGSFGLVLSTSLEADSELIVAARGQVPTPNPKCLSPNPNPSPNPSPTPTPTPTPAPSPGQTMSIAFYPESGLVLFGSEAAATKAAMPRTLP